MKNKLYHLHTESCPTRLGIASYILRTLGRLEQILPSMVYIDWTSVNDYQNHGEKKNIWDLLYYQPDVYDIECSLYDIVKTNVMDADVLNQDFPIKINETTINLAYNILSKKFILKDELQNAINSVYNMHMINKKCLAIHVRGGWYGPLAIGEDVYYSKNIRCFKKRTL